MNTKTIKSVKEKSWVLPGVKLTHKEFIDGIRKAQDGPFYTLEEAKKRLLKWKKERGL